MRLGELALHLLERAPQVLQRVLRDADAGILDRDVHIAADNPGAHREAPAVGGELHRVGQEIDHDLLDGAAVGAQADRRLDLGLHGQSLLVDPRRDEPHDVGEERVEIERLERERGAAGLDLRHVENVVDNVEQIAPALADVPAVFEIFGVAERAEHAGLHHFGKSDDGIERRAQLVAHVGEEG